ncbi:MAG TPA: hypothetical protein VK558_14360 [Patescibacteria group bacterium]|nr:hypothetical protein [Patescibacteria group bacterium]
MTSGAFMARGALGDGTIIETSSVAHDHNIVELLRRAGFPARPSSSTAEAD